MIKKASFSNLENDAFVLGGKLRIFLLDLFGIFCARSLSYLASLCSILIEPWYRSNFVSYVLAHFDESEA